MDASKRKKGFNSILRILIAGVSRFKVELMLDAIERVIELSHLTVSLFVLNQSILSQCINKGINKLG